MQVEGPEAADRRGRRAHLQGQRFVHPLLSEEKRRRGRGRGVEAGRGLESSRRLESGGRLEAGRRFQAGAGSEAVDEKGAKLLARRPERSRSLRPVLSKKLKNIGVVSLLT